MRTSFYACFLSSLMTTIKPMIQPDNAQRAKIFFTWLVCSHDKS